MFKKLLLILFFSFSSLYSQEQSSKSLFTTFRTDVKTTAKGIGHFYTSPLRWKRKDYIGAGAVLGGFAALTFIDTYVDKTARKHEPHIPEFLKKFGDGFGGHVNAFAFSGGIYATGLFTKNKKIRKTGALMFTSVVAAGSLQTIVKLIVGRARPRVGSHNDLYPFSLNKQHHAFPSGHSVVSMVFAHSIAKQIDNKWVKAGLYTAATIVPVSRVWAESHWVSDVVLGSTLGIITVNYLDRYLSNLYDDTKEKKLTNLWEVKPGFGNINVSYTFN